MSRFLIANLLPDEHNKKKRQSQVLREYGICTFCIRVCDFDPHEIPGRVFLLQ